MHLVPFSAWESLCQLLSRLGNRRFITTPSWGERYDRPGMVSGVSGVGVRVGNAQASLFSGPTRRHRRGVNVAGMQDFAHIEGKEVSRERNASAARMLACAHVSRRVVIVHDVPF